VGFEKRKAKVIFGPRPLELKSEDRGAKLKPEKDGHRGRLDMHKNLKNQIRKSRQGIRDSLQTMDLNFIESRKNSIKLRERYIAWIRTRPAPRARKRNGPCLRGRGLRDGERTPYLTRKREESKIKAGTIT